MGEYIGSHGEALFDRGLDELIFRSAVWATGTQLVRFSTGANMVVRDNLGKETADRIDTKPVLVPNSSFEPENHATSEIVDSIGCSLEIVPDPHFNMR